jgi:hypothetical protein
MSMTTGNFPKALQGKAKQSHGKSQTNKKETGGLSQMFAKKGKKGETPSEARTKKVKC